MTDYISRKAVTTLFARACGECKEACEEFDGFYADCNQCLLHGVLKAFADLPAADVRPVVRGEWDKHEDYDEYGGGRYVEWSCSECCHIVKRGWAVRDKNSDKKPTENFCPNCGADMREVDDGT